MAVISQGIKLSYKSAEGQFKELTNLQEIPELGGDVDKIEITTLADAAHRYTNGLRNYGDSVPFKFLYEKAQFTELEKLTGEHEWKVELPDATDGTNATAYTFRGTPSVKLGSAGVNAVLTYTLNIAPTSEMVVA